MIDPRHDLPIVEQAKILDISRSSVYYRQRPVCERDLALMRAVDRVHLQSPFAGARMMSKLLAWRLSNTLTTDFCVEALEEAIARYGEPRS